LNLVSIDPGLRHCGVAFFDEGVLVKAFLVKNEEKHARGPITHLRMAEAVSKWLRSVGARTGYYTLVVEYPRIYPGSSQQKGDLNDIVELGGVVSALVAWLAVEPENFRALYPSEWKGQVPKDVMNERVLKRLSVKEHEALVSSDHNTLDAVGIGLFHNGRLA